MLGSVFVRIDKSGILPSGIDNGESLVSGLSTEAIYAM